MSWFTKIMSSRIRTEGGNKKRNVPEGLWSKCSRCEAILYQPELEKSLRVCPKCGHHDRLTGRARLLSFLDEGTAIELDAGLEPEDPLKFRDSKKYRDRIHQAQKKTGEKEALVTMQGQLKGRDVVACAFHFDFMGGSMGSVVGEKFVRAAHKALETGSPLINFASSGGARMQESNGQNRRGLEKTQKGRHPVYFSADQPHHGRRFRFSGLAGGRQCGRTRCPDLLCRATGD